MIRKIKTYKLVTFTDLSSSMKHRELKAASAAVGPKQHLKKQIKSADEYFPIFLYFQKCEVTVVHCPIWHSSVIDDERWQRHKGTQGSHNNKQ